MTKILHIAIEFPNPIDNSKTLAIKNLVDNSTHFEHIVFALNRTPWRRRELIIASETLHAFNYWAYPWGIFLKTFLHRTARRLLHYMKQHNIKPDVIHAHMLTFDGVIGAFIAAELKVDFVCTVRGDTDLKLIYYKPHYHCLYRQIINQAKRLFFVAPWTFSKLQHWYGGQWAAESIVLPNIVHVDYNPPLGDAHLSRAIVSVCHLNSYQRKNLPRIIRAADLAMRHGGNFRFDIIGGGHADAVSKIQRLIHKTHYPERFQLLGHVENKQVAEKLSEYALLVLPSYPETFGMVYLEALVAGIPFIQTHNQGVDGYFDPFEVSMSVNHRSVRHIAEAINKLYCDQLRYKKNISALFATGYMEQFMLHNIVQVYEDVIRSLI